jgi:hypothetical protein
MSNIIMLNAVKAEYCFAECHHVDSRYADFHYTVHMLSFVTLSVIVLRVMIFCFWLFQNKIFFVWEYSRVFEDFVIAIFVSS